MQHVLSFLSNVLFKVKLYYKHVHLHDGCAEGDKWGSNLCLQVALYM